MEEDIGNEKEKLITDPNQLFATYDSVSRRIQQTIDESGEMLATTIIELMGDEKSNEMGQFNKVRHYIKTVPRIERMTFGQETLSCVKNSEDVIKWNMRYTDYLEEYLDVLDRLCRSGFMQVNLLYKKIDEMQQQIRTMEEEMEAMRNAPSEIEEPEEQEIPLTEQEKQEFFQELHKRFDSYKKIVVSGDNRGATLARGRFFVVCGNSNEKKRLAEKLFNELEADFQKECQNPSQKGIESKKNMPPEQADEEKSQI